MASKLFGISRKNTRRRAAPDKHRLAIESLEPRAMLSAVALPAAPVLTATAESTTQVNLSWKTVSGTSGYVVDELINGTWSQIGKLGSGVKSDAVTKLSPGATYAFEVGASDSAGTSWSSPQNVTTFPAAPSFTTTAESGTEIDLSWLPVSGASGYAVKEKINGSWKQIASLGSGVTSDAVTGLKPKTTYSFEVGASNSTGTSTSLASAESAATFPATPSFSVLGVSGTQIDLGWSAVSGASGYVVDQLINGVWTQIQSQPSSVTSTEITALVPGGTYEFRVGASFPAGTSWSNPQSATTLAAPTVTATPESSTEIYLSWGTLIGSQGYLISEDINGQVVTVGIANNSITSTTGYMVTGLSPGTTYQFNVVALYTNELDFGGVDLQVSGPASTVTATTALVAPTASAVAVSSTQVAVQWDQPQGTTSFQLYQYINGSWSEILQTANANTLAYTVNGLSANTTYDFDVVAFGAGGSVDSNVVVATTFVPGTIQATLPGNNGVTYYLVGGSPSTDAGGVLYENTPSGNITVQNNVIEFGLANLGNTLVTVTAIPVTQTFLGIPVNSGMEFEIWEQGLTNPIYAETDFGLYPVGYSASAINSLTGVFLTSFVPNFT
jgi:hypothetical protein